MQNNKFGKGKPKTSLLENCLCKKQESSLHNYLSIHYFCTTTRIVFCFFYIIKSACKLRNNSNKQKAYKKSIIGGKQA